MNGLGRHELPEAVSHEPSIQRANAPSRRAPPRRDISRMKAIFRGRMALVALAVLAACPRAEQASVEELYTPRMLGLSFLQRNQLVEAESAFTKLARLAPDDPLGFANLGLTYMQAGRYADAEKQLLRARELDPRGTEIGLALARVY